MTQRGQQLHGGQGIAGCRGMEHVRREQQLWGLVEVRRQKVGERHRDAAGQSHLRRLCPSQPKPPPSSHPPQRLRNRGDDAEIRTGSDGNDRTACPQSLHPPAETTRRRADSIGLGDVVCPDHDHRGVGRGPRDEHRVDLTGQALGCRADDRLCAEPNPPTRRLGQAPGKKHTRHFISALAAVSGCGGITEDHQMQVEGHPAVPALDRPAAR